MKTHELDALEMHKHQMEIAKATSTSDVEAVKALFLEYADFLNVDLCFQDFDREMDTFPDFYDVLFLAKIGGKPAAAVGLKNLGDNICEMKRLYARADYRRFGLGSSLCAALIDEARQRGFCKMRLDTLQRLKPALCLYRKFGFQEIEKYYDNPQSDVVYMELQLTS